MRVFVALGSNVDPATHVPKALDALAARSRLVAVSPFYVTAPIARPEQDPYWNGVAQLEEAGDPVRFRDEVLRPIEAELGRVRTRDAFAARTIDLDILLWGHSVLDRDGLVLPDPEIRQRGFLVRCLTDLDPDLVLPDQGTLVSKLLGPEARALEPAPFSWDAHGPG